MSELAARLDGNELEGLAPSVAKAVVAVFRGARAHPPIGETALANRLERSTGAEAWTEAALTLVRILAPDWHLRRLELDGGDWWCTLSRYPRAPSGLDDAVDGRDPLLPLAILDALLEALQRGKPTTGEAADNNYEHDSHEVVWCDNIF